MKERRKPRRRFSLEFKREAVKLFREGDKGISQVARELDITAVMLRSWVDVVEAEEKAGPSTGDLDELKRLRKENARLREEVEILGKATAFFAGRKP